MLNLAAVEHCKDEINPRQIQRENLRKTWIFLPETGTKLNKHTTKRQGWQVVSK
jgi:hypothetical protein